MSVNVNDPKSVIVIGGGVAGMNVIGKLLGRKPSFDITCITKEPRYDYSTCGLPFVLEGKIEKFEDIILHKPEFFSENNVRVMNNTEVTKLDLSNQTIEIHDQEGTQDLHYDYLVLATGRAPVKPPIQGLELAGVHSLLNLEDGEKLSNEITGCKSAVIIGGGIIGLEMALGFIAKGIKSTVVELAPYVLPALLDEDMAKVVAEWLTEKGVTIITDNNVQSIDGTEHVEGVSLGNGQKLNADLVLLSTGIKPNIELALNTGLGIGKAKGFVTDTYQHVQLNGEFLNNVFACGDCVESKNLITNQPMVSALASTALLQASAIANNILGDPTEVAGTVNPTVTWLHGLQIGSVGVTSHAAKTANISFTSATSTGKSRARYMPGWKNIHFKFLAQGEKIIGAQIIGEEDVKERINYLALVIREGISIKTILKTERCFTPPLTLLTDPMFNALNQLIEN